MILNPYRFAVAASYWNSADKAATAVLSDSNKQVNRTTGTPPPTSVRAVKSITAGKGYFEIATTSNYTGPVGNQFGGVCESVSLLDKSPADLNVTGNYVSVRDNSSWYKNDVSQGTHAGGGWGSGSGARVVILGVAYDAGTRGLTFYDNGVSVVTTSLSGTDPAFPFCTILNGANEAFGLVLRVKASEFTYGIPSGYTAWADV